MSAAPAVNAVHFSVGKVNAVHGAAILVLSAALLAAPWAGHVDDTDAQLYQVLSRSMAARHAWLDPGPMPGFTAPFRDHLPFGFWPYVAAIRVASERALPWVGGAFSLGTVALLLAEGGLLAALVLAVTETFFLYGARSRLDPPLLFFATAAALCVLRERPRWALASAAAAIAVLIKGPFGLVPLAAAAAARVALERRHFAKAPLALLAAAVPLAIFLATADQSWRDGYLHAQLLNSATGARSDGGTERWAALISIAGRFWPGVPLVLYGFYKVRGRLALTCAFALIALSLPARKVWNHELVAYPLLALLAGAAIEDFLLRVRPVRIAAASWSLAALACIGAAAGVGRRLLVAPCVASTEFAAQLDAESPGTKILVAPVPPEWRTLQALAAERALTPVLADDPSVHIALVRDDSPVSPSWREVAHARGWRLLRR